MPTQFDPLKCLQNFPKRPHGWYSLDRMEAYIYNQRFLLDGENYIYGSSLDETLQIIQKHKEILERENNWWEPKGNS